MDPKAKNLASLRDRRGVFGVSGVHYLREEVLGTDIVSDH